MASVPARPAPRFPCRRWGAALGRLPAAVV